MGELKDALRDKLIMAIAAERASILMCDWLHTDTRTSLQWEMIELLYNSCKMFGYKGELDELYKQCKELLADD